MQAVQGVGTAPEVFGRSLAMHDTPARRHPVDVPRPDLLACTGAVVVQQAALEQIADRAQPDVRVRPHVMGRVSVARGRAEVVHEDEGADAALPERREQPQHLEAAAEVLVMPADEACRVHVVHVLYLMGLECPRGVEGRVQWNGGRGGVASAARWLDHPAYGLRGVAAPCVVAVLGFSCS